MYNSLQFNLITPICYLVNSVKYKLYCVLEGQLAVMGQRHSPLSIAL